LAVSGTRAVRFSPSAVSRATARVSGIVVLLADVRMGNQGGPIG
jgi:hypothetical protein